MSYSKVTYHVAANCGGCAGIDSYWQALDAAGVPFAAYSANDAGLIVGAAKYQHATLIYRDVAASTVNPSDYAYDPQTVATYYWQRTIENLPDSIKALKARCWIELLNEPGKEGSQANWVGLLMYYMALLALQDGYRIMGPGWAPGNPEPEHWLTSGWELYLRLCAAHPDSVAVSIHEYSLDNDIHNIEPWLIGRFRFLFDACEQFNIPRPATYITECGWTLNSMPPDEQAKADIAYLSELYAEHAAIKSAHLWTLQAGKGNGDLPTRLNALMGWLTQFTIETTYPDVDPPLPPAPPVEPPTIPMSNLLFNPSFELDWHDATAFPGHIPDGWTVRYNFGAAYPNPYGQPYKNGEAVKKHRGNLPPEEQDVFVWDGDWTYKVFGGGTKSFWFEMSQTVAASAGDYKITVPVWVDHYHWHGYKNYAVDPNQAQVMIVANGVSTGRVSVQSGGLREVSFPFTHGGGALAVSIHLISNWDINGNFWIDGLSLSPVTVAPPVEPPGPGKWKSIIFKLPQDVTESEVGAAVSYITPKRRTLTFSHDDLARLLTGGNDDSYAEIAYPARQQEVVTLVEQLGYQWIVPAGFAGSPLDGLTLGQPFAWRYVMTSPFNATRAYGKHEGTDYDIIGGNADNKIDVLCLYDGIVDRSLDTAEGYGKYIRVRHTRNGGTFYTRYAHLDKRYAQVGQTVQKGQALGEVGATGNANGEHIHINLEAPGFGLSGYVVADVVNPAPYIPDGLSLPLYAPPVTGIDMAAYFFPAAGGFGDIAILKNNWGQNNERQQLQRLGDISYVTKNSKWERRRITETGVFLEMDTSPNEQEYYRVEGQWLPRRWQPGDTFTRTEKVSFYYVHNCQPSRSPYTTTSAIRFEKLIANWTSPAGIALSNVIELAWVLKGVVEERYWFAPGLGLCQWQNKEGRHSWIIQLIPQGQQGNNVREIIGCSAVS